LTPIGRNELRPISVKLRIVEFIDEVTPSDSCEKIGMKICLLFFLTGGN